MRFHDPRAQPAVAPEPYGLSIDLSATSTDSVAVGLLANGFPDSVAFLDQVGDALAELAPSIELRRYDKGNASVPAPEQLLEGIRKECKAVVTAYGH